MSVPSPANESPLQTVAAGNTPVQAGELWRMEGPLTVRTVEVLHSQFRGRLAGPGGLAVDLGAVDGCDCIGLQLLVAARKSARAAGKPLSLNNLSPAVLKSCQEIGMNPAEFTEATWESHP